MYINEVVKYSWKLCLILQCKISATTLFDYKTLTITNYYYYYYFMSSEAVCLQRTWESVFVVCQLLLRKLGMNLCEFWDDRSWDKEQSVRFYGNPGIFFRRHLQYHQTLSTFTRWHYQSLALRSYAVLVLSICWWVVQYRELTKFHNFCLMHQCSSSFQ